MAELAPHLLKYDHLEPSILGELALQSSGVEAVNATPLVDPVDVG